MKTTITAKLICGIRESDHKDPLCGLWIEPVSFPMTVTNYEAAEPSDPEELVLESEAELRSWAERSFDEMGYAILDREIPISDATPGSPADACGKTAQAMLDLISSKKAEYERVAPSTPGGRGERDAVIAALDTLDVHARALVSRSQTPASS